MSNGQGGGGGLGTLSGRVLIWIQDKVLKPLPLMEIEIIKTHLGPLQS